MDKRIEVRLSLRNALFLHKAVRDKLERKEVHEFEMEDYKEVLLIVEFVMDALKDS